MLSLLRTAATRAAARPILRLPASTSRALSFTPRLLSDDHHGHPPAINVGQGAKAGQVATDENQSTGLERFQIAGQNAGVDVFNMEGVPMSRQGTLKDPIIVPTFVSTLYPLLGPQSTGPTLIYADFIAASTPSNVSQNYAKSVALASL